MRAGASISTLLAVVLITACASEGPTGVDDGHVAAAEQPALDGQVASSSIVTEFPAGPVIPGASAWIARSESGVNVRLQTSYLTPGHAYTLWIVPFNNPENCVVPNACVLADALANDPAVAVDLINGTGLVAGGSGKATFAARVRVGDLGIRAIGLIDALGSEIHLVVRDHGPKLPGSAQLAEFGGGCDVYACANVQLAASFEN